MRWLHNFMFGTFWMSACLIFPLAITMGVNQALYCIIGLILSSLYFTLPISERS